MANPNAALADEIKSADQLYAQTDRLVKQTPGTLAVSACVTDLKLIEDVLLCLQRTESKQHARDTLRDALVSIDKAEHGTKS